MSLLYGNCLKTMMENVLDKGRKKTFLKLQQTTKNCFCMPGRQRENFIFPFFVERKFLRIVQNFPHHSEWGKKMDIGKLFNCYTDVNSNFKQFLGIILLIQSIYLSISLIYSLIIYENSSFYSLWLLAVAGI